MPTDHPVDRQQSTGRRAVAGSGAAAAGERDDDGDWQEFQVVLRIIVH
ncbi:MAG: hypothetical protein HKN11_19905 [Rhizobiales bacterium]|nr:hypothetical protein [Hyphomicrobiales bacterium]